MTKSKDAVVEQINIVEPAFPVALYEIEKYIKEGYSLSQTREPIYIAGLYDIVLVKGEEIDFENFKKVITEVEIKEDDESFKEVSDNDIDWQIAKFVKPTEENNPPIVGVTSEAEGEHNTLVENPIEKAFEEKPAAKRGPKPKAK